MDPVQKMWAFHNWIADQNDQAEVAKNHAYLLASFWDPEAVQKILGEGNVHISSEEDLEESMRMVREQSLALQNALPPTPNVPTRKRRKRTVAKS